MLPKKACKDIFCELYFVQMIFVKIDLNKIVLNKKERGCYVCWEREGTEVII